METIEDYQQNMRPKRSKAWILYGVLAVSSLFAIPSHPVQGIIGSVVCGLYSRYLFRGGRFVLWIW
ncbi:MAG: hypothetical protein JWN00_3930 [Actinomycetia bacterium]|nr:hypothetical protein [Actinomycetes bacterium]